MREIMLTQGKIAIVDDEDFDEISQYKWYAWKPLINKAWYARRRGKYPADGQRTVLMHRQLLRAPSGVDVDHIDGNGLNNSRSNLRLCTGQQNRLNSQSSASSTSGFKGVSWASKLKRWQAQICLSGKNVYIGYFADEIEAARAYDDVARKLHGTFARLNFPESEG